LPTPPGVMSHPATASPVSATGSGTTESTRPGPSQEERLGQALSQHRRVRPAGDLTVLSEGGVCGGGVLKELSLAKP
jgi:hypothetical protein